MAKRSRRRALSLSGEGLFARAARARRDRGRRHDAVRPRLRDRERAERVRSGGAGLFPETPLPDADDRRADRRAPDALRRGDRRVQHLAGRRAAGRRLATDGGGARGDRSTGSPEHFREELRGPPRILSAPGHSFSDMEAKVLHLVNLASVRALEEELGRPVDPLRFRPNIVIDGAPAWSELDWAEGGIAVCRACADRRRADRRAARRPMSIRRRAGATCRSRARSTRSTGTWISGSISRRGRAGAIAVGDGSRCEPVAGMLERRRSP